MNDTAGHCGSSEHVRSQGSVIFTLRIFWYFKYVVNFNHLFQGLDANLYNCYHQNVIIFNV